jgi:acyl-CoA hydrolase
MKQYTPVTPEEAVSFIKSNDNVFIHSAAASPQVLGKALAEGTNL